jgi:hypothetical protein
MMKGGSAIYCPACGHRQTVGHPGEKLELPLTVTCEKCSAALSLVKSESLGVHVTVAGAGTH